MDERMKNYSNFDNFTVLYNVNATGVLLKFQMRIIALNANNFAHFQCNYVEYYVYVK